MLDGSSTVLPPDALVTGQLPDLVLRLGSGMPPGGNNMILCRDGSLAPSLTARLGAGIC